MSKVADQPDDPLETGLRTWVRNLMTRPLLNAIVALSSWLFILELILRSCLASPSPYLLDTDLGPIRRPYARMIQSSEGYLNTRLNNLGFLDTDIDEKSNLGFMTVALGDSDTEASQVSIGNSYANVAERILSTGPVVNAGQSGLSPFHYPLILRERFPKERIDAVVVQLNDGDLSQLASGDGFRLSRDTTGQWVIEPPDFDQIYRAGGNTLVQVLRAIRRSSALANQVVRRIRILSQSQRSRLLDRFSRGKKKVEVKADDQQQVDIELLLAIHTELTEVSGNVIYLYLPAITYFDEQCSALVPERLDIYTDFARRANAPLIDPTKELCAAFEADGQPLHGFQNSRLGSGHMNSRGHAIVGNLLAEELRKALH